MNSNKIVGVADGVNPLDAVNKQQLDAVGEIAVWTQDHDADGNTLILDADGDSSISSVSDDSVQIVTGGSSELSVTNGFVTVPNSLIVNGNTTLGNASTDIITTNARFASSLIPNADNAFDLGINTTNRWRDLWLGRNASVLGTMIVGGATSLLGNVQLGFSSSNTISFDGRVSTDVLPNTDGTKDMGGSSNHWDHTYSQNYVIRGSNGTTTGSLRNIYGTGSNMVFNVPSGDGYEFNVNNSKILDISSSGKITPEDDIDFPFGVYPDLNESQSSAGTGIASSLPSKPEAYIKVKLNGVVGVVPWYPLT